MVAVGWTVGRGGDWEGGRVTVCTCAFVYMCV